MLSFEKRKSILAKEEGRGLTLKQKLERDQGIDMLNSIIRNKKRSLSWEEFFKQHALEALAENQTTTQKEKEEKVEPKRETFPKSKTQA